MSANLELLEACIEYKGRARELEGFVRLLLDPERYGHAVTAEVRDHARELLGLARVEGK